MKHSILFLLLVGVTPNPGHAQTTDFFRPGSLAPDTLPADGIFPQGKTMHIGGYSPSINSIKQLGGIIPLEHAQKSGFTVAGPYYGSFAGSKATVERAATLGMHVAAQLEVPPALHFQKGEDPLKLRGARMAALPETELRMWVQECMDNFLKNPPLNKAVSCWAIAPEELRFWYKAELNYQQAFLKAVHDFDPQHRPAFMYEPNHRTTDALLKTGPGQGFILQGAYVHNLGWDVKRALRINWALDQMTGAATKDKRVVIAGLELSQDMPGFTAKDIEGDPQARTRLQRLLRHDVYLALARGAQGFQVWSLHPFRKNLTTYLELVNGYGEVFRELSRPPLNLQVPIFFGERRQDLGIQVVKGPAFISTPPKAGALEAVEGKIDVQKDRWPAVRLANIVYGTERVLLLVNSAAETVEVRLTGLPDTTRLQVISGGNFAQIKKQSDNTEIVLEPFAALVTKVSK